MCGNMPHRDRLSFNSYSKVRIGGLEPPSQHPKCCMLPITPYPVGHRDRLSHTNCKIWLLASADFAAVLDYLTLNRIWDKLPYGSFHLSRYSSMYGSSFSASCISASKSSSNPFPSLSFPTDIVVFP